MAKICAGAFRLVPTEELVPYVNNARIHGEEQILQLRASMREFGFLSPIVIDGECNILAGHGRLMAARAEGMAAVPCVIAEDLTPAQRRAYILADNRLAETATWDKALLDIELQGLQEMSFDCAIAGFEPLPDVSFEDFDGEGDGGGSQLSSGNKVRVVLGPILFDIEDADHAIYGALKSVSRETIVDAIGLWLREVLSL